MNNFWLPRIAPFSAYMAFVGIEGGLRYARESGFYTFSEQSIYFLYPIKVLVVICLLFYFRDNYSEINFRDFYDSKKCILSLAAGFGVFILWINMDWLLPGQEISPGFNPGIFSDDPARLVMIFTRIAGAALIVPIMEEIFWRSFLLRYIISSDFWKVPVGQFTWISFLVCAGLFGLEHHFIIAGIMAGLVYSLLLYATKSIAQCILAHAVTNFALGIYVLQTGRWYFW